MTTSISSAPSATDSLDLAQTRLERRKAMREGGRHRRDMDAGAPQSVDGGRDEGMVDADGSGPDAGADDAETLLDVAAERA